MRVLVVGFGNMGRKHFEKLIDNELISSIFVFDTNHTRTDYLVNTFSNVVVINKLSEIETLNIDCAIIATPPDSHYLIIEYLSTYVKFFLVEKPLTLRSSEARSCIDITRKAKVKIFVGYLERFNPAVRFVRHNLIKGAYGRVLAIHTERLSYLHRPRSNPGVVYDLASHDIDLTSHLLNCEYEFLHVQKVHLNQSRFALHAALLGRLTDSTMTSHRVSFRSPKKKRTLSLVTEECEINIDLLAMEVEVLRYSEENSNFDKINYLRGGEQFESYRPSFPIFEPLVMEHSAFFSQMTGHNSDSTLATVESAASVTHLLERLEESEGGLLT